MVGAPTNNCWYSLYESKSLVVLLGSRIARGFFISDCRQGEAPMALEVTKWVWELELPAHLKIVALALADHAHKNGGSAYPSQALLAKKCGTTDRTVRRSLAELIELGVIEKQREGGKGKAVHYKFCDYTPDVDVLNRGSKKGQTPDAGDRYPGRGRPNTPDVDVRLTIKNPNEPFPATTSTMSTSPATLSSVEAHEVVLDQELRAQRLREARQALSRMVSEGPESVSNGSK